MVKKKPEPPPVLPAPGTDDLSSRTLLGADRRRGKPSIIKPPPPIIPSPLDEDDDGLVTPEELDLFIPEIPEGHAETVDRPALTTAETRRFHLLLQERARREKESLRLYRPFPTQEAFHASRAGIRLARGGNRGGKTLMVAVEAARAFTGQDIYTKYPRRGRAILVGKDLKHCGEVMYRKLFKGGSDENAPFKIIRDEATGKWRAYHPAVDRDRRHLAKPASALIPPRFIKSISWENKREEIAKKVLVEDGRGTRWEVNFFSGEGEPPQGWDVDFIWLDEEIPHPKWFSEMLPRVVEKRGVILWSATPQVGTHHLYELSKKAADQADDENPRVVEFFVNIFSNEYIDKEAAEQFAADLADDEEEYRVRVLGDFAIVGKRIYPEFQPSGIHKVRTFPVPDDWCRYIAVDPGRQTAAAAVIAVPPPDDEEWGRIEGMVCNEIYVKKANARTFSRAVKDVLGEHWVAAWLIDGHEARKHETGTGKNIEQQYVEAFLEVGLGSNGFDSFIWGNDDPEAGILAVKNRLHVYQGMPSWVFQTENLRWMLWEFERYANRSLTKTNIITDKPIKLYDHLMDCLRYLAQFPLRYQRPPKRGRKVKSWTVEYLKKKRQRAQKESKSGGAISCF